MINQCDKRQHSLCNSIVTLLSSVYQYYIMTVVICRLTLLHKRCNIDILINNFPIVYRDFTRFNFFFIPYENGLRDLHWRYYRKETSAVIS